jgi:outer membrane immunogenic protein
MGIRLLGSAALAALFAFGSAHAADLPARTAAPVYKAPAMVQSVYNWTGFYIGINGGGAFGKTNGDILPTFFGGNHNISGGLVGGTVGFNYQVTNLVFGVEADWDWADINGSQSFTRGGVPLTESFKLEDLGTARGRVGYAWDSALLYATGGFAWTSRATDSCPACALTSDSHSLDGWTAGGGLEYGFTPNLSAKIEYLYAHLQPTNFFTNQGCTVNCGLGANVNVVRAGLNWRFGPFSP